MAICSCGLPARCCQPAVAGGFIYADLWGELSIHLALQDLFTQSSPVHELLLQAFPFPSTLGEETLHPVSQACVFVYTSCGKWVFPVSCGVFLSLPLSQAFPLLVAGHVPPLPPSPVRPGLFIYSSVRDSPAPFSAQGAPPSLQRVFIVLITQFLFFFLGGGLVCPGGYADLAQGCLWEYCVPLSSPCPRLPKPSGCQHLVVTQALLISLFNVKWRCSVQAGGVEGSKFCLFSVALLVRCVSSISLRFHFRRQAFCFLPLATILESPPQTRLWLSLPYRWVPENVSPTTVSKSLAKVTRQVPSLLMVLSMHQAHQVFL
jgi:hypothetical protein